jgi:hypothetical protein
MKTSPKNPISLTKNIDNRSTCKLLSLNYSELGLMNTNQTERKMFILFEEK